MPGLQAELNRTMQDLLPLTHKCIVVCVVHHLSYPQLFQTPTGLQAMAQPISPTGLQMVQSAVHTNLTKRTSH